MSEMVDRLAEAIHDAANKEAGIDEYCSYEMGRAAAKAVFAALREPTEAMCAASLKQDYAEADKFGSYAGPIERWRAMIGVALK